MVKSLCFSVIPGSVMLTHTVLEGFITEYNHTLITSNVFKENLLQEYGLRPSNAITAEGLEDKVSPSTPTA